MPEAALVHPHSEGVCSACAPALSRHKDTTPCWPFASSASSLRRLSIAGPELSFPHATSESQSFSFFHGLTSLHKASAQAARRRKGRFQLASCLRQVANVKLRHFLCTFVTEGGSFKTRPCTKRQRHALNQHSEEVISRSTTTINHTDQLSATRPRHRLINAEGEAFTAWRITLQCCKLP